MHRWLMIFLLCVVPIQMVWGAAAPYCAHETTVPAKKHFGHHEHQHQGGERSSADDEKTGGGTNHVDCESCHLGTSAALTAPPLAIGALPDDPVVANTEPCYRSHVPSGLERPDRLELTAAARFGGGVEFRPLPA